MLVCRLHFLWGRSMTAMLFSRATTSFNQLNDYIDTDILETLIAREEENLKIMHGQFIGSLTLCRLQLKLINALKSLLNLIGKPCSVEELMQQISKIMALYHEVDGELSKSQRHKEGVSLEILAQEQRLQEMIRLISLAYYNALNASAAAASRYFREWAERRAAERDELQKQIQEAAEKLIEMSLMQCRRLNEIHQNILKNVLENNPRINEFKRHLNKLKPYARPKPKPGH